ncbi:hypothetical protein LCL87_21230 [Rhodococcus hoagii]|nr:hypothetical protein [Prescottella equi]
MNIADWWPKLSGEVQDWLVEHNGEPLDPRVRAEIEAVNDGVLEPGWSSGESVDGQSELTDEAVDWIDTWANGENRDR